ncbi:MAG: sn-glycerol-3-phosphate ABC transporter ATP-binding protein UgpC [Ancalomicrobiaceae bacterium]|nr:sn-glycerol-3-phosphate ABC transporter ATP-binding protein UgpC [Ancalomicrobiaceae bacterium]
MSGLDFRAVTKCYGDTEVLHQVDFSVATGEFVVFVGPSGCGKSTLLRMIAGLEDITTGEIAIDDEVVNDVPAAKRGIAMVFQSYALYPHMTVRENMGFGLRMARLPKAEIARRVGQAADMLQLGALLDRLPRQLSGGQRQRVAIGRAITRDPKVFLFDEPLSNLDAALRVATRIEIAKLKQRLPDTTMIYVTHDQVEAMTLADRIVVLSAGIVQQIGTPIELYSRPANRFVAGFIGSPAMNFLDAVVSFDGDRPRLDCLGGGSIALPPSPGWVEGEKVTLGIRPENLNAAEGAQALLRGTVSVQENLGELVLCYLETEVGSQVIAKLPSGTKVRPGETLALSAESRDVHVFNQTGRRHSALPD